MNAPAERRDDRWGPEHGPTSTVMGLKGSSKCEWQLLPNGDATEPDVGAAAVKNPILECVPRGRDAERYIKILVLVGGLPLTAKNGSAA